MACILEYSGRGEAIHGTPSADISAVLSHDFARQNGVSCNGASPTDNSATDSGNPDRNGRNGTATRAPNGTPT